MCFETGAPPEEWGLRRRIWDFQIISGYWTLYPVKVFIIPRFVAKSTTFWYGHESTRHLGISDCGLRIADLKARSQEPESRMQEKSNQDSLHLSSRLFEPQNIEQGISNIEVITSAFCGSLFCCYIQYFKPSAVCRLTSDLRLLFISVPSA